MKMYAVGGYVRDRILGIPSKDLDFSVEADSYEDMIAELKARGVEFYLETPEYFTARGRDPKYGPVDYVWARREGPYVDGRHPDWVKPGTIEDDLSRRDFTMNAMCIPEERLDAKNFDRAVIDPWNGLKDMNDRVIRTVGSATERFAEDPLRVLRAMRFSITKDMKLSKHVDRSIRIFGDTLTGVSADRIREELTKMFAFDTFQAFMMMSDYPAVFRATVASGIWFKPTQEKSQ